jgi:hypothetical protein
MPNTNAQSPNMEHRQDMANGKNGVGRATSRYAYVADGMKTTNPIAASIQYAIPNTKHSAVILLPLQQLHRFDYRH